MIDHNHFICHLILGTFTEYPYVETQLVGKRFFRLYIVVAESGLCTVYRCHQDNLLGGEVLLQVTQCLVDSSPERVAVQVGTTFLAHFLASASYGRFFVAERIPFAQRYSGVIVVCSGKNNDGVYLISNVCFQLLYLFQDTVPLIAVDTVYQRFDSQHFGQILPVVFGGPYVYLVGDGVA